MKLIKVIKSSLDSTLKYIFKTQSGFIVEFSYIDKNDGKDIICLPCQTMCNIGCKFCHTTDYIGKIKTINLDDEEMSWGIGWIINDRKLMDNKRVLLISFMGCGEPLLNVDNIAHTMRHITDNYKDQFSLIRYAIATSMPKHKWEEFFKLTQIIYDHKFQVKIHLSLHYTIDLIRKEWMPASLDIIPSLSAVDLYKKLTGNAVEIHYTLIDGINDTEQDAILLSNFLKDRNMNVKFLFYNEKESIDYHASNREKISIFRKYLDKYSINHEYYMPPGADIGSSCGMFLMDYYLEEYNNYLPHL